MDAVNTRVNQLLEQLADVVNRSELPPAVVGLALDKVRTSVRELEVQCIVREGKEGAQS